MIPLASTCGDGLPAALLIGLTGKAGSGKDTCASLLQPLGFVQIAFADPLRAEVAQAWALDERHLTDRVLKHTALAGLAVINCRDEAFIRRMEATGQDLQAPRTPRWLMQRWGTEYRRAQNQAYWVDQATWRIGRWRASGLTRIVVSDVRFDDEADCLVVLGGKLIDVQRPDAAPQMDAEARAHVSEDSIQRPVHAIVRNSGDLKHLELELLSAIVQATDEVPW